MYAVEQKSEFGGARYALLFLPGRYQVDVPIGFYTEVLGLEASPDAVVIEGNVHADASLPDNNATCTFWRAAEGFSVIPAGGTMQWAVSQAVPFRRMHVHGNMVLNQNGGWASWGWMSDTLVDGDVDSGSQQQWISRNSAWGSWTGSNWNMVFVGVPNPPPGEWPAPPYTKVDRTPVVREKPFLKVDRQGNWSVRLPTLRKDGKGITWRAGSTPGQTIPLSTFYIARQDVDTAASINKQLAKGRNLLFTPGIYQLDDAIRVKRPNTVVMGLGFATLRPAHGTAAMTTTDRDGIEIAGLLFDAGPVKSPVLLEVGPEGSKARHAGNPICLHDVFFRVGSVGVGRAQVDLRINSSDTIVDHTWIWRADHGAGVGWNLNTSANGLVVNGDDVTAYRLFVEHHQQFQVLWNGNGRRMYFYQSEIPYDPPALCGKDAAPRHDSGGLGAHIHGATRLRRRNIAHTPSVARAHRQCGHCVCQLCGKGPLARRSGRPLSSPAACTCRCGNRHADPGGPHSGGVAMGEAASVFRSWLALVLGNAGAGHRPGASWGSSDGRPLHLCPYGGPFDRARLDHSRLRREPRRYAYCHRLCGHSGACCAGRSGIAADDILEEQPRAVRAHARGYPRQLHHREQPRRASGGRGNSAGAVALYREALAAAPDYAAALANLGHEQLKSGQFDQAQANLTKALDLSPDRASGQADLGLRLGARGDFEDARRQIERSLILAPGDADNESNSSFVLTRLGRPDEAIVHCNRALRISPGMSNAQFNLDTALAAQKHRSR
ncbi:MAG: tetratricopeptide repeat protein [Terracidiphilus sp.]